MKVPHVQVAQGLGTCRPEATWAQILLGILIFPDLHFFLLIDVFPMACEKCCFAKEVEIQHQATLPFCKHVEYCFALKKKKKVFYVQEKKVKLQNRVLKSDISSFPLTVNDQSRSQSENNWRYLKQLKALSSA